MFCCPLFQFLTSFIADVLCDSYSQRVFASFGLLDSFTKGYFTLDDFVERGLIVEEFLSLNVNTRTLFHVMVIKMFLRYNFLTFLTFFTFISALLGFFS